MLIDPPPDDRSRSPSPRLARHRLAIQDAIAAESTPPPCETKQPPVISQEDAIGISNDAQVSSSCCSSGSEHEPSTPRRRPNERLRCVPEFDKTLSADSSFCKRRTSDNFRATRSCRIVAPLAQVDPDDHVILAADANFKMQSEATEELGETPSTNEMICGSVHSSLARTGSFSKRSTRDGLRAKRGARGALCRASHAVLGADDDFNM